MSPDLSRRLRLGAALGLILPLGLAGAARAQSPGWIDPPAKTAPAKTTSTKTAPGNAGPAEATSEGTAPAPVETAPAAASVAAPAPVVPPRQEAVKAAPNPPRPAAEAETERDDDGLGAPSRRAEGPRLRRRRPRRLADVPAAAMPAANTPANTPAMAPRVAAVPRAAADPRFSDWAAQAQDLAGDYLAAFSGPNGAMVSGASRFYGDRLRFHGRMTTFAALLAEKRRFAQRWPERRYEPHDTRTACNAALQSCIVRTLVDFRADNPARALRAQGLAELVLEVSFAGGRPVIVSESSRVLRRGAAVGALSGAGANG